jgi:hypothetical protein
MEANSDTFSYLIVILDVVLNAFIILPIALFSFAIFLKNAEKEGINKKEIPPVDALAYNAAFLIATCSLVMLTGYFFKTLKYPIEYFLPLLVIYLTSSAAAFSVKPLFEKIWFHFINNKK